MLNRVGAIIDTVVGTLAVVAAFFSGYQYAPGKKYDPKEDALRRWRRKEWKR